MFFFPRRVIQDSHPQEPPCGAAQPGDKCYEDSCLFPGGGGLVQPAIQPGYDLGPARSPFTSTLGSRCLGMVGWLVGWLVGSQFKRANLFFWRDNFSRDFCFPFLIEAHDLE